MHLESEWGLSPRVQVLPYWGLLHFVHNKPKSLVRGHCVRVLTSSLAAGLRGSSEAAYNPNAHATQFIQHTGEPPRGSAPQPKSSFDSDTGAMDGKKGPVKTRVQCAPQYHPQEGGANLPTDGGPTACSIPTLEQQAAMNTTWL
jgi:hypothetical protein